MYFWFDIDSIRCILPFSMSKTLQEVLLLMQIIGHIWSTFYFLNLFWIAISKYTIPKYSSSWSHHTVCQLTLLF